jgi:ubiquinone/menaquinone biosynthesis C-methylase UbiE
MDTDDREDTLTFWNGIASDWDLHVGADGDANRILNSDPVLWRFVGDVTGLEVLDAGCGTGYLSRKLVERGARVIGVDFSPAMIQIARAKAPEIDFRVESCSDLASIGDESIDVIVSNYVLMDTPDLEGTMSAFRRVLKSRGAAVLVFSHPCFPAGRARVAGDHIEYPWDFSYFDRRQCVDPPWGHFTSEFIWFHRPLSDYWKGFGTAGFEVLEFEEPRITEDKHHLVADERRLRNARAGPTPSRSSCARRPAGKTDERQANRIDGKRTDLRRRRQPGPGAIRSSSGTRPRTARAWSFPHRSTPTSRPPSAASPRPSA